ncbi:MAG: hypothetical protein ISS19_16195 [Bacteroidales bacterium]|nr:hypothetical protein [Bacteroidales bacterium]
MKTKGKKMKKTFVLFLSLVFMLTLSTVVFAQSTHTIDFESSGVGADWTWVVDQNDTNPDLEFVANPDPSGINTSDTTAKFTALETGFNWALCYTNDDGEFTFDSINCIVKIDVYKDTTSVVAIKFEGTSPPVELQVANTITNQWEELTYDFSGYIGNTYDRIVVIPDFVQPYVTGTDRARETIVYFDNIEVPDGEVTGPLPEPSTAPPVPTHAAEDVIPIYTEVYTDLPGTDFDPDWGQSTTVTVDYLVAGNYTLKYESLNYQGTQYTNTDVSAYEYLHIDFWTPNAASLDFYLISPGAETFYSLPITQESWVSVDIPLTDFVPPVDLTDVFQFKVVGNGVVYFDNWYFWKTASTPGSDATLSDLQVDGSTVPGFAPLTENYTYELVEGTVDIPQITTATPTDPNVTSVDITQAPAIPGDATVVVTSQNGLVIKTYTVSFAITTPNSVPPTPTQDPGDVICMFSDAYTNVAVDTWLTAWSDGVFGYEMIAENQVIKYSLLNTAGIETTGANLIDATSMTHFHMDIWTPDANDFKVKLVDWGADAVWGGGDDTEHELIFAAPVTGTWISYDIPLTDFVNLEITGNMAQYILVKAPFGTIYLDNMYFWEESSLEVPEDVAITMDGTDVTITWSAVTGANSYKVYSYTDPNADPSTWTLEQEGIAGTSWDDESVTEEKKFYYVKASTDAPN